MSDDSAFGAAHGGKPPAYHCAPSKIQEATPPFLKSRGIASERRGNLAGKPEAYRHVLRQSRKALRALHKQNRQHSTHPESVPAAFLFLPTAVCLLPSAFSNHVPDRRPASQ